MIDLEMLLIHTSSTRFKELREATHKKVPPDLIANGQKSAILRIEKGKNTKSGNFISDTLLDCYANYFLKSKKELIFGTEKENEAQIFYVFREIFEWVILKDFLDASYYITIQKGLSYQVQDAVINLFYAFADFGRWYDLRKESTIGNDDWEKELVDVDSMINIMWLISKNKLIRSFEELVIGPTLNEIDGKFHFNRINDKFNRWLNNEFVVIIVPELLEKLEANSIFKMGFMVKSLIDKFLTHDFPPSCLEDIPLEEFIPPIKSYHFHLKQEDRTDENIKKMAEELFRFLHQNKENKTVEDLEKMDKEAFFQGVSGVTDESRPFINGTRTVSTQAFLDNVLAMPEFFDSLHELNRTEQKIPGVLTVNSHAANLLQQTISEVIDDIVNSLVRYQNIFINCIKWKELQDFAK